MSKFVIDLREKTKTEKLLERIKVDEISFLELLNKEKDVQVSLFEDILIGLNREIHSEMDFVTVYLLITNQSDDDVLYTLSPISERTENNFRRSISEYRNGKVNLDFPKFFFSPGSIIGLSFKAYLETAFSDNPHYNYVEEVLEIMKRYFKNMRYAVGND